MINKDANDYLYDEERFFPKYIFDQITEIRINNPEIITSAAMSRKKRRKLTKNGNLTILAADHPGRGVTALGGDPLKMGNRRSYLGRVLRVLSCSEFDGFMATPDFIEDLFILDYLIQENGGPSFLDEKVLVGCMQRGGVAGVVGEIDDRFGSYTAESISKFRLDGGKFMFRFVPDDERTLWTIDYCAKAVTELNELDLVSFVEPLRMDYVDGKWVNKNVASELIKLVGVISALGDSSRYTWIKIPHCEDFELVANATTLPIMILGGPSQEDPRPIYSTISSAMSSSDNVRGALVGRNVTFPGHEDPAAVAQAIYKIVNDDYSLNDTYDFTIQIRDQDMETITKYFKKND